MIRINKKNISLINWDKRQNRSLTGYERLKRYRNRRTTDNEVITGDNAEDNARVDKSRLEEYKNNTFDQFWSLYPKKVAKRKAELAWKKIKPSEYTLIYADVQKRSASEDWRKSNGQYIPYPTSYLNGERWKDQVNTPSTAAPPKRICRRCNSGKGSGWMEGDGAWIHMICEENLDGLQKLSSMKSELFKSTPKAR